MITDDNGKLKQARYNTRTVPCPFNPVEILKHWNDDEYGAGDIRYPYGGVFEADGQPAPVDSEVKLSEEDREYLQQKWTELRKGGFESFGKSVRAD